MDHLQAHEYLISKPETTVSQPFGEGVDVYKVKGKMFATLALGKVRKGAEENPHWWMNLKCAPDEAHILRDIFDAVIPGYHMNKRLWNTIILDSSIPQGEIERMIDNSFMLVVEKMPKKAQTSIYFSFKK
ncbi:MmcQ/YjbR family DNA-binding protein [Pseudoalteromonas sp. BZB3]|uniref:MmcQ/YjbR family DNA-binding protein n=1 Tax=Pseudoalteromonas sp. BZB3 TaxID=3136670 RepID=UPI0032C43B8C